MGVSQCVCVCTNRYVGICICVCVGCVCVFTCEYIGICLRKRLVTTEENDCDVLVCGLRSNWYKGLTCTKD